jgi:hypothetical protein
MIPSVMCRIEERRSRLAYPNPRPHVPHVFQAASSHNRRHGREEAFKESTNEDRRQCRHVAQDEAACHESESACCVNALTAV